MRNGAWPFHGWSGRNPSACRQQGQIGRSASGHLWMTCGPAGPCCDQGLRRTLWRWCCEGSWCIGLGHSKVAPRSGLSNTGFQVARGFCRSGRLHGLDRRPSSGCGASKHSHPICRRFTFAGDHVLPRAVVCGHGQRGGPIRPPRFSQSSAGLPSPHMRTTLGVNEPITSTRSCWLAITAAMFL